MATWKEAVEEAKKQLWLTGPMVFVCVFQYSLQIISLMFSKFIHEKSAFTLDTSFGTPDSAKSFNCV